MIFGKAAGGFVTATARPFVHEGPRRATKGHEELQLQKGNCRTATATAGTWRGAENCNCKTFCPRRATEGHEGPRRTATAEGQLCLLRDVEGRGELQLQDLLSTKGHGGPRRATKNCNCRRATAELQLQHFLSAEGRGGARRIATARPFVHEGPRTRRATKGHEENYLLFTVGLEGL